MTMFLSANLVAKICRDLGEGGLTRASLGPYSDQGRFLFAKGYFVDRTKEPTRKISASL